MEKNRQHKERLLQPECQEALSFIPGVDFPPRNKCVIQMSTSPQLLSCVYYTCLGGVPTAEDVKRAIDDLESFMKGEVNGNLADGKFDFMKSELIIKDAMDIKKKVLTHSILFKHQCQVLL